MRHLDEITINWHLTEACNFGCNYCYAKWSIKKTPFRTNYPEVLRAIAGLVGVPLELVPETVVSDRIRINFAGGEPFLVAAELEAAIRLAHDLGLRPSFITNGVLLDDALIERIAPMTSVAGFSFDSFDPATMARIGRHGPKGEQLTEARLARIFALFRKASPSTVLKINTVVCAENADEDLREGLARLAPDRWKMLRVLPGHGGTLITDEAFAAFVSRHGRGVVEDNADMHRSYLMMNPEGRFYQREGSGYVYSDEILKVGAEAALRGLEFDAGAYAKRYEPA